MLEFADDTIEDTEGGIIGVLMVDLDTTDHAGEGTEQTWAVAH